MDALPWENQVVIFDDEDVNELISEFVQLCACYWPDYSYSQIAEQIFMNRREPMRFIQAAAAWGKDLSIRRRIDKAKLNGNKEPEELTLSQLQARIIAVGEDMNIPYQQKKLQLDSYELYAKTKGWIINNIDKKVDKTTTAKLPAIFMVNRDAAAA